MKSITNIRPVQTVSSSAVGIPESAVLRFLDRLEESHVPMHSVLLMRHGKLATEGYYAPYQPETLHRMFSICKSLNALAIGVLIGDGKIDEEDKIVSFFPDKLPADVHPWIATMTIRNLLMMRTCHVSTTYKHDPSIEWVESFFTVQPTHKPGTVFHYDTSASHVLCMLVERITGKSMLDFLRERLLDKIGWSKDAYLIENPFGDPQGGSGLMCTPMDLMLLGKLLLQRGIWEGEQLLPRDFVDTAVSCLTPNAVTGGVLSEMQGYGYQIWRSEHNGFVCYGMGGQLVLCLPDHDVVMVTTADTQGMGGGNQFIYNSFYEEILPALDTPETNPLAAEMLSARLKELRLQPVSTQIASAFSDSTVRDMARFSLLPKALTIPALVNGKTFTLAKNIQGFQELTLSLEEKQGKLAYTYHGNVCVMDFGLEECKPGTFPVYDFSCVSSGAWIAPDTFYIKCHLTDACIGSVHAELVFGEKDVTVFFKKIEETLFTEYNCHLYGTL